MLIVASYNVLPKDGIGLSKYKSTSATCAITKTQCSQSVIRNLVYNFVYRLDKSNNTKCCESVTFLQHCILFKNTFPMEGAALCSWCVVCHKVTFLRIYILSYGGDNFTSASWRIKTH